ncbi:site-specific integrase [Actinomadura rubrisoli]|uniref:Site-specific integrase n=1 Tax=Actinomadura rubrisoli TaxID=2530368 RepID=A0A4R5BEF4_9ACTN|nr:site-specific integrase [Actinomadura rubrisoli]TDD83186.1 site-specific integrase [Actinomadura rubrisoli]
MHAARHSQIRALALDDVDLPNRRLTIDRRTRPLDDLTHRLLTDWLTHRHKTWPGTANPHLLTSAISANGTAPVSHTWLNRILRGLPATLEALRIDRQLDEALTNGADPLHLSVVFGLHATTAIRYADSARQLLRRPHQDDPPPSPRT